MGTQPDDFQLVEFNGQQFYVRLITGTVTTASGCYAPFTTIQPRIDSREPLITAEDAQDLERWFTRS